MREMMKRKSLEVVGAFSFEHRAQEVMDGVLDALNLKIKKLKTMQHIIAPFRVECHMGCKRGEAYLQEKTYWCNPFDYENTFNYVLELLAEVKALPLELKLTDSRQWVREL